MLSVQLEEQRSGAKEAFDFQLQNQFTHKCGLCPNSKFDPSIITAIADKLSPKRLMWPPLYVTEHSLRQILVVMNSIKDFHPVEEPFEICPKHQNHLARVHTSLEPYVDLSSHHLLGLCLSCTKRGFPQLGFACENLQAIADRVVSLDPMQ